MDSLVVRASKFGEDPYECVYQSPVLVVAKARMLSGAGWDARTCKLGLDLRATCRFGTAKNGPHKKQRREKAKGSGSDFSRDSKCTGNTLGKIVAASFTKSRDVRRVSCPRG